MKVQLQSFLSSSLAATSTWKHMPARMGTCTRYFAGRHNLWAA